MIKIAEIQATNKERAEEIKKVFKDSGYTIASDEEHDYLLYVLKDEKKQEKYIKRKIDIQSKKYYAKDYPDCDMFQCIDLDASLYSCNGYRLIQHINRFDYNKKDWYVEVVFEKVYYEEE